MLDFIFAIDRLFHRNLKKVERDYWVVLLAVVVPVLSITPISLSYTTYVALTFVKAWRWRFLPFWLHVVCFIYAALETATFLYLWTTWVRKRKVTRGPELEEETLTSTLRKIFSVPVDAIDGGAAEDEVDAIGAEAESFRQRFTGWFFKAPFEQICHDNVLEWLCWTTYNLSAREMTESQLEMCGRLLVMLEARCRRRFTPGWNRSVKSLRLNLDPIPFVPRPLLFYLVVYIFNFLMRLYLYRTGFERHRVTVDGFVFEYYHRPGTSKAKAGEDDTPLLFIHGMGMGLAQYRAFIGTLLESFSTREMFLLAQGQISMMPTHKNYCNPPPTATTIKALDVIATEYSIRERGGWTIMSHSFGSIVHSWMIKHFSQDVVRRSIMVDPVCFRLWESDVCYNFLYRRPRNATQLIISYFVGKELGVAYSLHRAFWWSENLLLPEDIDVCHGLDNFMAYLGGKDEIVNSTSVHRYLISSQVDAKLYKDHAHGSVLNRSFEGGHALEDLLRSLRFGTHDDD